ncbi:MFS transporter [Candidatus Woesearchaeota archaeon]|nr:MFS transporter [Candidatus Woesearchaeota archaeon]
MEEKKEELSEAQIEEQKKKSLKYSIGDGITTSVMDGSGSSYISPFAIALGASNTQIGFLSSIPGLFSPLSQLITVRLLPRIKSRKKVVLTVVLLQALTWLPIMLLPFIMKSNQVNLLIILFTLLAAFGSFGGPVWASWMGDLIKSEERGKYFGNRNSIAGLTAIVFSFISAYLLDVLSAKLFIAFTIMFSTAMLGRLLALYFLNKQYEPEFSFNPEYYFSFTQFLKKMPYTNFGKFSIYFALIVFTTNIAAPFFAVYMLKNLHFTYLEYMIVTITATLASLIGMRFWGKISDLYGNIKTLYILGFFVSLVPLWWVFNQNILFLICIQLVSGFAWGGFNLSASNFIYDVVSREKRALAIAYFNVLNGIAVFLGASLGALLLKFNLITFMEPILFIFLISAVLRLIVHIFLRKNIHEARSVKQLNHIVELVNFIPMQGFVTQIIGIMSRKKKVAENESLKEEPKKELEIR